MRTIKIGSQVGPHAVAPATSQPSALPSRAQRLATPLLSEGTSSSYRYGRPSHGLLRVDGWLDYRTTAATTAATAACANAVRRLHSGLSSCPTRQQHPEGAAVTASSVAAASTSLSDRHASARTQTRGSLLPSRGALAGDIVGELVGTNKNLGGMAAASASSCSSSTPGSGSSSSRSCRAAAAAVGGHTDLTARGESLITSSTSRSSSISAGGGCGSTSCRSSGPSGRALQGAHGMFGSRGLVTSSAATAAGRSGVGAAAFFGGGGNGSSGSGRSDSEDRGLPPPLIISPVALRVVVIGWMGSSRRYLNKYGALWARSGDHEVLIIRPTVAQTLVRWRGVVVAGRDIDRVARLHRENPAMPTVYHVFSTGGFIHAGTMWRWMDEVEDVAQRRDLLEEVRGIILDSAPASVNADMASRAIVSAVTHTPAEELRSGMPGMQGLMLEGARTFLDSYLKTRGVQLRTEEVYDAWYNLAPVCPQLYLYSDADPLVPTADVERYMGVQESRGVEVRSHKWVDSGHVEHFRRYPHEYAYQISAFLAQALRDW